MRSAPPELRLTKKRIARRRQYGRDGLSFLSTDDDDEDISVSTHSSRTSEYYGKIAIGRQEFLCVFDTGSGNLLIPTTTCTDDACLSHKLYDPKKSKTSRQIKFLEDETTNRTSFIDTDFEVQDRDVVSITFGTGEVSGILMQDQVCVGEICAETKFVGANSETSQPFELVPFDGILGLSLKEMSESSDFNFFQNLIDQKVLERNCFAVFFGDDNEPSEITFGSFKKERMLSKFHWVDVSVPGYWQISLEDIQVNNQKLNLCAENNGCNVAIDTGTSLLAAPSSIVEQLAESLNINEDCTNYDTLPNLGFIISGKLLSLDKSDYVDRNGNDCILGLMTCIFNGKKPKDRELKISAEVNFPQRAAAQNTGNNLQKQIVFSNPDFGISKMIACTIRLRGVNIRMALDRFVFVVFATAILHCAVLICDWVEKKDPFKDIVFFALHVDKWETKIQKSVSYLYVIRNNTFKNH
eukprot:gene919-926_t